MDELGVTQLSPSDLEAYRNKAAAEAGLTGRNAGLQFQLTFETLYLTPFLLNPERYLCAASAVQIIRRLLPVDTDIKVSLRVLRTHFQPCLVGMVLFVSISRTDEERKALETRLNKCSCDISSNLLLRIYHDNRSGITDTNFSGLVASIFWILDCLVSQSMRVGHVAGGESEESDSTAKKWPPNITAFFPSGQEDAILSFSRLYRSTQSYNIIQYIRNLLPHCPSLALPTAESSLFWEVAVEGLQDAAKRFTGFTQLECEADFIEDSDGRVQWSEQTIRAFILLIHNLITAYERLHRDFSSSGLTTCSHKVYDALLKILHAAKSNPDQNQQVNFGYMAAATAQTAIQAMPASQRPLITHPLITWYSRVPGESNSHSWDYGDVFGWMCRLFLVAQCCNAGCKESSESCSTQLRYCSRCRLMRYCSTSCQKSAWKSHRTACADFAKLTAMVRAKLGDDPVPAGQLGKNMVKFEKEARKLGFVDSRMKELSKNLAETGV
ncbi:hypothetical protein R3P38DRAFT_3223118 [Favolaschia claudopus]|uniref:MYND-type domain-containing protein n=1 Tax=Favolaschia claudopus TaxID=2862362 RepID=A0AAV9ZXV1_9AGAR